MSQSLEEYPFISRVITDSQGQITEVVISYEEYLRLLEEIEEEGLYRAMMQVKDEKTMSKEEAMRALNQV